jgi:hypothetical protein
VGIEGVRRSYESWMIRSQSGKLVGWGPETFGYEVVAAAYHCYGADVRVEKEGSETVVDEVAAGVEGYDHCVDVFGLGDGGEVGLLC